MRIDGDIEAARYLKQEFPPNTKTDGVPNAWKSNFLSYLIFLAQKRETFGPQVSQCGVKTDENVVRTSPMGG